MSHNRVIRVVVLGVVLGASVLIGACDSQSPIDKVSQGAPATAVDAARYVNEETKSFSDQDLKQVAVELVKDRDNQFIKQLVDELIYQTRDKQANKLAVLIAEQGFLVNNDPVLANRAGLEYKIGRYVEKDYQKAAQILGTPVLRRSNVAKFYLAEVLLADDNPNRDPARGKALLVESADAGVIQAKERLQKLN